MSHDADLLFDFSAPEAVRRFAAIDDRVMGGVSQSTLRSEGGVAVFEGVLSTEHGGGFASVRSAPAPLDLSRYAGLELRVRGDGRAYRLRIRTDAEFDGIPYQAAFATSPAVWTTVCLPFEDFRATRRGHPRPDAPPLDTSSVTSFGLMVADTQVGAFRLELESLRAFA